MRTRRVQSPGCEGGALSGSCPACGGSICLAEHPVRDVDRGRILTYHQRCAPSMRGLQALGGDDGWPLTV
jgi:hypothetical protein